MSETTFQFEELQNKTKNTNNTVDKNIKELVKKHNRFDTKEEYDYHIRYIENILERELLEKIKFRKLALKFSIGLISIFFILMIAMYAYLLVSRNFVPGEKLLLGLSVTVFVSIISLISIMFKYLFSNTKDTTDYIQNIRIKKDKFKE